MRSVVERFFKWLVGKLRKKKAEPEPIGFKLLIPAWNQERILYGGVFVPTKRTAVHYLECKRLSAARSKALYVPGQPMPTHHLRFFYKLILDGQERHIINQPYSFVCYGRNSDELARIILQRFSRRAVEISEGKVDLSFAGVSPTRLLLQGYQATVFWQSELAAQFKSLTSSDRR
jgi:hypothetical protein